VLLTEGIDVKAVAHPGRTISATVRTALQDRDPTCVVSGCDVRQDLEIDHVVPFTPTGPTELENLARLCRWHHYLKTHCDYRLVGGHGNWSLVGPDPPA
jgi:5-methylcytosine-specific restriction endonuclease McrA